MTQKMLCVQQGYLEFVEYRSRADLLVRFVNAGEDARISLVERPMRPGEWGVARRGRRVNAVRAYIVQWAGQDVIDVRIVQSTPGCS